MCELFFSCALVKPVNVGQYIASMVVELDFYGGKQPKLVGSMIVLSIIVDDALMTGRPLQF